jgi:hypothetical protein
MRVENDVRVIGVFISSPGDVAPERGRAQAVTAKLNRQFEGLVRFETVLWEERFYKADQTFQSQIPDSITCDIVLSIFWTRIGTELPAGFPLMANGRPYPSGTAYELLSAIEHSKRSSVPDVYVFRKTADAALPTTDIERRRQAQLQLDALEGFWAEWFKIETGQFKAAFQSFDTTDAFEQQLELLLRQWLETHNLLGPRLHWPKEKGSPFPGLAAFEAEQAAVFFGRDRAIEEARRRLVSACDRGTPFLLIVGASGAGKSSLARAGLIPRLTTPGVVASVDLWRAARMKPSDGQAGPLLARARARRLPDACHAGRQPQTRWTSGSAADRACPRAYRCGGGAPSPFGSVPAACACASDRPKRGAVRSRRQRSGALSLCRHSQATRRHRAGVVRGDATR